MSSFLSAENHSKMKTIFRDLENPKLLFNCTALMGFMSQYSLFLSGSLFIVLP